MLKRVIVREPDVRRDQDAFALAPSGMQLGGNPTVSHHSQETS